jgi:hypothetical protein
MPGRRSPRHFIAGFMMRAPVFAGVALACTTATGATLAEKAKESGCVNKPLWLAGDTYRCATQSGAFSYFNVPDGNGKPAAGSASPSTPKAPTPASFPRVDPETQKGRDGVRRKVLAEELASEEKLLTESRAAFADGAPPALPEERTDAEKYRARIARLRQSVTVHEKNVEALKKELAAVK